MTFVVKRADPKEAQLNNVPEGEYSATLISVGEPTHYGPGHKLKLPLRFQIDGYSSGVVLRRLRLVDRNGEPYEEFGPNTDMIKFLEMAGVAQPDDAIGMQFIVRVSRNGAFCDVSDVLHTCTPHVYSPRNSLLVTPNSKLENRESIPETPTGNETKQTKQKSLSLLNTNSGTDKTPLPAKESRPNNGQVSPAVVSLARELTYLSDGDIVFLDRHRTKLAEILQIYPAEEITRVWKGWFPDRLAQGDDPNFIAKDFVEAADSLCYTAQRKKQEAEENRAKHDATARRMQAEAEQKRRAAEAKRREEELFDPIGIFSDGGDPRFPTCVVGQG